MSPRRLLRIFLKATLLLGLFALLVAGFLTSLVLLGFTGTAEVGQALYQTLGVDTGQGSGATCGLVFGAAVHRGTLPGPGIARRVSTAARLYREGVLQHIILSGGKGGEGVASEAEVMRDVALNDGIAAGDITLEEESRSTWENLMNSRPLTGSCSLVIGISDRYHLARIGYLARKQGFSTLRTLPSDLSAPWYFELRSIGREVAAILYYMVITHLFPLDAIAQHGLSALPVSPDLGLLITKSDHLVCQLIC